MSTLFCHVHITTGTVEFRLMKTTQNSRSYLFFRKRSSCRCMVHSPDTIKRFRYFGVDHIVDVNFSGEPIQILLGDRKRFWVDTKCVQFDFSTYPYTTFSGGTQKVQELLP